VPFAPKWTPEAEAAFLRLQADAEASLRNRQTNKKAKPSKAEGLFKQVHKSVNLLLQNPRHPGLKTNEYDSIPNPYKENEKVFEASAQNSTPGAHRIFWCYGPRKAEITFLASTPHP
jgi:hypothetical protein